MITVAPPYDKHKLDGLLSAVKILAIFKNTNKLWLMIGRHYAQAYEYMVMMLHVSFWLVIAGFSQSTSKYTFPWFRYWKYIEGCTIHFRKSTDLFFLTCIKKFSYSWHLKSISKWQQQKLVMRSVRIRLIHITYVRNITKQNIKKNYIKKNM